jgi:hypothetical protein
MNEEAKLSNRRSLHKAAAAATRWYQKYLGEKYLTDFNFLRCCPNVHINVQFT